MIDIKSIIIRLIKLFWIFPIQDKKIVFRSSQGEKYNCNPKYLSEYLINNHKGEFKIVWLFKEPKKYYNLKSKGITVCKEKSIKGIYHLTTSKFLIDNHGVQSYLPIRKEQITINTWHGGGSYKKSRKTNNSIQKKYNYKLERDTKYFISSCEKFSSNNLKEILRRTPNKILSFGMARNDIFFEPICDISKKVKDHFEIPLEDEIILFAPTYRESQEGLDTDIDWKNIINTCNKKYHKNFHFCYRMHEFVENKIDSLNQCEDLINVNDYEDMQELIAAAEIIITDYSSLIWDAAIAKKQCYIYATDLEDYMNERDFYTPIKEWPFPIAKSNEQLINNIKNFDNNSYVKNIEEHLNKMGSYEEGISAKQTYDFIKNQI